MSINSQLICVRKEKFENLLCWAQYNILKINEYFINTINFIFQQMGFIRAITLCVVLHLTNETKIGSLVKRFF